MRVVFFLLCANVLALNAVRAKIGADYYTSRGYRGEGVVCGVVDDVDITFNDFRDPLTHQTRVLAYKRFYTDASGKGHWDLWPKERIDSLLAASYPPDRYHFFDSASIFHNRRNGHGTVIANIMAGNGTTVPYGDVGTIGLVGLAPASPMVIVSRPYDSSLIFIDSVARAHHMPWAANVSWTTGPPEAEVKALAGQGKPGRVVVAAAGNDNFRNFRKVVFSALDTIETLTFSLAPVDSHFVGRQGPRSYYFYMTSFNLVYKNASSLKTRFRTQYAERPEFAFSVDMAEDSAYFLRGAETLAVFEEFQVNKSYPFHQQFDFYAQTDRTTDFYVDIVKGAAAAPETLDLAFSYKVHNWAPYGEAAAGAYDTSRHTLVDWAMADEVITVGGNVHWNIGDTSLSEGEICPYSAVGPSFDGRVKPDLVAPAHGMTVLTTDYGPDTNNITTFVFMGTSFSAPLVAGGCLLLLQEDSTRDAQELKDILFSRAGSNQYSGTLPNEVWGHGILNLDPTITPLSEKGTVLPDRGLFSGAPNPFHSSVVLCMKPPFPGGLRIFDVRGRQVADLTRALRRPVTRGPAAGGGVFQVEWNAGGLPSGIYVAVFKVADKSRTLRLVKLK